mgnify:CR=1 FL=1
MIVIGAQENGWKRIYSDCGKKIKDLRTGCVFSEAIIKNSSANRFTEDDNI